MKIVLDSVEVRAAIVEYLANHLFGDDQITKDENVRVVFEVEAHGVKSDDGVVLYASLII